MKSLWRIWPVACWAVLWARAWAQTPAPLENERAIPFAPAAPSAAAMASAAEWSERAGRNALADGLPSLAIGFFQDALSQPGLEVATKDALNLDLATAYLAQGQVAEARAALKAVASTNTPVFVLRTALLAARSASWNDAASQIALIIPSALPAADQPWYYTVQALLAEQQKDPAGTRAAWEHARDAATTPLQRDQFEAALWRVRIYMSSEATPDAAEKLRQLAETYKNQSLGAQYAREYAITLDKLGRHADALDVVTKWLGALPDDDREAKDGLRLLLALLDEKDPALGDPARDQKVLQQVLQGRRADPAPGGAALVQNQEIALEMLKRNRQMASDGPGLKQFLDTLINDPRGHPLLEQLYLLQAQLALSMGQLETASTYAIQLLEKFPLPAGGRDPSHEDALRLLAYVARHSNPPRYRTAADYLIRLRDTLPAGAERTSLGGLLADLYFLNHDYRNAADLYASLIADPAPSLPRGALLERAVESDLLAAALDPGRLDVAMKRLDEAGARADIAAVSRWRAEWNVVNFLRENGRESDAFARMNKLLGTGPGSKALPEELRLRLLWLAARLSVDERDASAADRVQALQKEIEALPPEGVPDLDRALRAELTASALLLSGEAAYLGKKPDDKRRIFEELRKNYPNTDAAVDSLFFEAHALADEGNTAEAQRLMNDLAEQYKDKKSEYGPLALYEAAFYAKARGKANQYDEALTILRKFVDRYPNDPLIYMARLMQGEIERISNNFADALGVYEFLLRTYPNHPLTPRTEMARADCLMALAAMPQADLHRRDDAMAALERLVDLPGLPVEAHVEAGFKWGSLLDHGDAQGNNRDPDGAEKIYYLMVTRFFDNAATATALANSPEGSVWMSKCLFALAGIRGDKHDPDGAQQFYRKILQYNLPGRATAESYLAKPATAVESAVAPPAAPSAK